MFETYYGMSLVLIEQPGNYFKRSAVSGNITYVA